MALLLGLVLAVVGDQAIKLVVRACLGQRSVSLGPFGRLRIVQTQMWAVRALGQVSRLAIWSAWFAAAGAAVIGVAILPVLGVWCGLLLGGALSHAIETSLRGSICDYVCPSFWPAFNLADVALVIGAVGLVRELVAAVG